MKKFSEIIIESRDSEITIQDLSDYLIKYKKKLPTPIQQIISLLCQYDITDEDILDRIKSANGKDFQDLSKEYNIPLSDISKIQGLIKSSKENIRMVPLWLNEPTMKCLLNGEIGPDDLLIDLSTTKGKNQAAKQYMPLVYKIVNQFVGRSRLSKSDLISVALAGLSWAIKDWTMDPSKTKKGKLTSFKSLAAYRINQSICLEIDANGHSLSGTNYYAVKKYGTALDAMSLDKLPDEDDFNQDHFTALGMEDKIKEIDTTNNEDWKELIKMLEKKFPERTCNIFYRYMGLNGYKKETLKEISKSTNIPYSKLGKEYIDKVLKWMKEDKKAREYLINLQDIYTESLMTSIYSFEKDAIIEYLMNDDTYLLFEELIPWRNKLDFQNKHENAMTHFSGQEAGIIEDLLSGDFLTIDNNLKKENKLIKKYVLLMYPKINVNSLSDVSLLDKMLELQEIYKKK